MEVQLGKGLLALLILVVLPVDAAEPPANEGSTVTPSSAQPVELGMFPWEHEETAQDSSTSPEANAEAVEPEPEPEAESGPSIALPPRNASSEPVPEQESDAKLTPSPSIPWYRNGMLVLAGILVLIVVLSKLVKKYVPTARISGDKALNVIARTHISPKQSIALVRTGNTILVVGITPDRLTRLGEITDPTECFNLVTQTGSRSRQTSQDSFDRVLNEETEAFDEALQDSRVTQKSSEPTPQVQQTVGHLRSLVSRLKTLQESQPLD